MRALIRGTPAGGSPGYRPEPGGYRWRARTYPHAVRASRRAGLAVPVPVPEDRRRRRDDETCQAVLDILRRIDAATGGDR